MCVCVLFLTGCGGPASRARFGAPDLLLLPPFVRSWFVRLSPLVFGFLFFTSSRPRCLCRSVLSGPRCPGPWRLVVLSPPPLVFLPLFVHFPAPRRREKPTGAPRATGPDEARRTNAGPRGTPERRAAGHYHSRGQVRSHNGHWLPRTREARTTHNEPRHRRRCTPHTAPTASGKRAWAARPKERVVGDGRAPVTGRPRPRQEPPPPGALVPPPQRA